MILKSEVSLALANKYMGARLFGGVVIVLVAVFGWYDDMMTQGRGSTLAITGFLIIFSCAIFFLLNTGRGRLRTNAGCLLLDLLLLAAFVEAIRTEYTSHIWGFFGLLIGISAMFLRKDVFYVYALAVGGIGITLWLRKHYGVFGRPDRIGDYTSEKLLILQFTTLVGLTVTASGLARTTLRKYEEMRSLAESGFYASEVAHQLKTPIQAIGGVASQHIQDPDARETIDIKLSQITRFVKQFEAAAKHGVLVKRRTELTGLMQHIIEELQKIHGLSEGIQIELLTSEEYVYADVDPNKVEGIFSNLVRNAIEAIEGEGFVTVTLSRQGFEWVEVTIRDTGTGISNEDKRRVFDPYFSKKIGRGGSGLGLAIAKNYVEDHQGLIWLESEEGKGTLVTVTLPV